MFSFLLSLFCSNLFLLTFLQLILSSPTKWSAFLTVLKQLFSLIWFRRKWQWNVCVFCILYLLPSGVAKARVMAYFGEGTGPIHVDNVKCSGEERSLADCIKQAPGTHNCRHSEDAGVICDYGESQPSYKEVKGHSGLFVFYLILLWNKKRCPCDSFAESECALSMHETIVCLANISNMSYTLKN